MNGIENAVVLLSYPAKSFGKEKALRAFISTNAALSDEEILDLYVVQPSECLRCTLTAVICFNSRFSKHRCNTHKSIFDFRKNLSVHFVHELTADVKT